MISNHYSRLKNIINRESIAIAPQQAPKELPQANSGPATPVLPIQPRLDQAPSPRPRTTTGDCLLSRPNSCVQQYIYMDVYRDADKHAALSHCDPQHLA